MPSILIYRHLLLPPSETFIVAQTTAMKRYVPFFVCTALVPNGLELPAGSICTLGTGNSLWERLHRRLYRTAGLLRRKILLPIVERRPALIHAHFATDACAALPLVEKLKIPLVVTLHGFDVHITDAGFNQLDFGRHYLARRERLWKVAKCFICVSDHNRRKAIERGFPPEKLWLHYIGIDVNKFRPTPEIEREQIVLFVGRLIENKGCIHLIRAMAQVQAKAPAVRLVIIGDGPLKADLKNAAESSLKNYQFLGSQSSAVVKQWLTRCRIFSGPSVVASNGNSEGLGIVFCEAQAMGVPVVSFATGGIPEVVVHGEGGLLAKERDETMLAEYILRFLNNPELWRQASEAGRKYVELKFDLRRQTELLEAKYDELIAAEPSQPKFGLDRLITSLR